MGEYPLAGGGVFAARYRVVGQIGAGGFGAVYEAEHLITGRRCALKVLMPHAAGTTDVRERFLRESKLAAQIQSEFIVDVLDAGVDVETDLPFIAMDLLKGEDLGHRIRRRGRASAEETVLYLSHAAAALDVAHDNGIVHRDLKPSNLFLTRRSDGSPLVKVLDFGTAKLVSTAARQETTAAVGTPIYMAPEQFRGDKVTSAVDIYALGMLAFRLLVGRHYFALERDQSTNNYALGALLVKGVPEPAGARAARYGASCDARFDAWFARATNNLSGKRFESAGEAIAALARALDIELAAAPMDSTADVVGDLEARAGPARTPDRTLSLQGDADGASSTHLTHSISPDASRRGDRMRMGASALAVLVAVAGALTLAARGSEPARSAAKWFRYTPPSAVPRPEPATPAMSSSAPTHSPSAPRLPHSPSTSRMTAASSTAGSPAVPIDQLWTRE